MTEPTPRTDAERARRIADAHMSAAALYMLPALIDAVALLQVYTATAGSYGPNNETRGQALSVIRDARKAIAMARGEA